MMFICPVCREAFQRYGNSYKCRNGHCFDIAKQGYVNLLTGSKGGNHGDNRLMTSARRAFLNKGYYDRFLIALTDTVKKLAKPGDAIIDCGCGEGYYTTRIADSINNVTVAGFDISKDEIVDLTNLTPGDFVVIKKQADLLDITDKSELLSKLRQEQLVKNLHPKRTKIGF